MPVFKKHLKTLILLLFCFLFCKTAFPSILKVGPSGYPYQSIQAAIDDAVNRDEILVYDGTYFENIDFMGKRITVRSENGPDFTFIDGNYDGRVVMFINNEDPNAILSGFTIQNGLADYGAGIKCEFSSPSISDCIIIKNLASFYGGGMYCYSSSPTITNCIIKQNIAYSSTGGGIYCYGSSTPLISNCDISRNVAQGNGGGVFCSYNSNLTVINCTISFNTVSHGNGGGIHCQSASPIIINCTLSENTASFYGGGIACYSDSYPTVTNSILWGNKGTKGSDNIYNGYRSLLSATYSDIQQDTNDIYSGVNNINVDPLFASPEQGNYYLQPGSPCIDKGSATNAPSEDKEGIQRPQGETIDMGAYESVDLDSCIPRASFTADQTQGMDSLTVSFDASSSGGSQYTGVSFSWDFGDGETSTGPAETHLNITHTYNTYGPYDVSLAITIDGCGAHKLTLSDFIKIKASEPTKDVGSGYPYTSIQQAIDDAQFGEHILVHDGTYVENINFKGKVITVLSENGPKATIIDGNAQKRVVTFNHAEQNDSVLDGFTIRNGLAENGGGVFCNSSSPTIDNCLIIMNKAKQNGGGVYCDASSPMITNCKIKDNISVEGEGAGIYCNSSSLPIIINCTISGNMAYMNGGGMASYYSSSPKITNSIISNNIVYDGNGGGLYYYYASSPILTNCTLTGNRSNSDGGGIYCHATTPVVLNSILWGDMSGGTPDEIHLGYDSNISVAYSDIQQDANIHVGIGNINSDPLFVLPEQGNYYLQTGSPCIDTGTFTNAPPNDNVKAPRPQGPGIDMGAYEYMGPDSCIPRASFTADKTNGMDYLTVFFDASSSGGSQYNGASFSWDFGDGETASGPAASHLTISHTYNSYGAYDVSLTVTSITECGTHKLVLSDFIKIKSSEPTKHVGAGYPYTSIQQAINDAQYGELILVHDGTYVENINFKGKGITLLSENGPELTVIDGNVQGSVVTFNHAEKKDTVLNGFTIRNGLAKDGAGIHCSYASPMITHCVIRYNQAYKEVFDMEYYAILGDGAGIYCYSSSPVINECTLIHNTAYSNGGGIYCYSSSPMIIHSIIKDNIAYDDAGGGIYCDASSFPSLNSCSINGNMANYYGGGIYCSYSAPGIKNSILNENVAYHSGGGVFCSASSPMLHNCTFTDNTASSEGGGIYCEYQSSPTILNSIFWGDKAGGNPDEIHLGYDSNISVAYSDIQQDANIYAGIGNINADPLFVSPEQGNYYLQAGSPCIDTGTFTNAPSKDKEGAQRPQGPGIDLGAYEYFGPDSCIPRASFTADQTKGMNSLTVLFDASSSGGSQYDDASFSWDFGDGETADGPAASHLTISHTYNSYGAYDVSLTITTACGTHKLDFSDFIKVKSSQPTKEVGTGYPYASIQQAINNAQYGELILVHDGTYMENINFKGKEITLLSDNGSDATIIDGNTQGSVVTFHHMETKDTVLDGFTLRNGLAKDGAGIHCAYASPTIINCTLMENVALREMDLQYYLEILGDGAGIYCFHSSTIITNCLIKRNRAYNYGGGMYCSSSSPIITNSTISDNFADYNGGGIYLYDDSSATLLNGIVWGDMTGEGLIEISVGYNSLIDATYSNIQQDANDVFFGTGNINADPLFLDPNAGDYHIDPNSPCVDKGTNINAPKRDKDGIVRPQDGDGDGDPISDMGAYEYEPIDRDYDGFDNDSDNCPWVPNSGQTNSDGDLWGDACDNCPYSDNEDQSDEDKDGIGDVCDNCPAIFNPDQFDTDGDAKGDICEDDHGSWSNPIDLWPGETPWRGDISKGVRINEMYGCLPDIPLSGPEQFYRITLGDPDQFTDPNYMKENFFDLSVVLNWDDYNAGLELFLMEDSDPNTCIPGSIARNYPNRSLIAYGLEPGIYYLVVDSYEGPSTEYDIAYTSYKSGEGICEDPIILQWLWFDDTGGYGNYPSGDTNSGDFYFTDYACSVLGYEGPEMIHTLTLGDPNDPNDADRVWDLVVDLTLYDDPNMDGFLLTDCNQNACLAMSYPKILEGYDGSALQDTDALPLNAFRGYPGQTYGYPKRLVGCGLSSGKYFIVLDGLEGGGTYDLYYKSVKSVPGTCEKPIELPMFNNSLGGFLWGGHKDNNLCGQSLFDGYRCCEVDGNTVLMDGNSAVPCPAPGPEKIYTFTIPNPSETSDKWDLILNISSDVQMGVFLLAECNPNTCLYPSQLDMSWSYEWWTGVGPEGRFERQYAFCDLDPQTYYLVVDSLGSTGGEYVLDYSLIQKTLGTCEQPIELNQLYSLNLGSFAEFFGTTACGVSLYDEYTPEFPNLYNGPDKVHKVVLYEPVQAQVCFEADSNEMALFILTDCADPNTVIFHMERWFQYYCQDTDLDPGIYYLIIDGYNGLEGNYKIRLHPRYPLSDYDGDRIPDPFDHCPNDFDNDFDRDGLCADADNCPWDPNPDQQDSDEDIWGDACDNCLFIVNNDQADADEDDIGDVCDNCPTYYNPNQDDPLAPVPDTASLTAAIVECGVAPKLIPPTATDNCMGKVFGTTDEIVPYSTKGSHPITWTYEDEFGNTFAQLQTVIVTDTKPPIPKRDPLPDVIKDCVITGFNVQDSQTVRILACDPVTLIPPKAIDKCEGIIITATTEDPLLTYDPNKGTYSGTYPGPGTYSVTWIYDDGSGNIAQQIQTIILKVVARVGPGQTFEKIRDAIDEVTAGEVVKVAQGPYIKTDFTIKEGVTLDGSWNNDFTLKDTNVYTTIINLQSSNTSLVFIDVNVAVVDGFEIINGDTGGPSRFITVSGNIANCGGGIYCENSTPTILNCNILDNRAYVAGGGLYCINSAPTLTNCIISGNDCDSYGGGICCLNSSPIFNNCIISENTSSYGSGIFCDESSSPIFTQCTIWGNDSSVDGGGIYSEDSMPLMTRCIIKNNTTDSKGGGIYWTSDFHPTILNCIFYNNTRDESQNNVLMDMGILDLKDMEVMTKGNFENIHILIYDSDTGLARSSYKFFGKTCRPDIEIKENDITVISIQP